jgi:hypothetical protein
MLFSFILYIFFFSTAVFKHFPETVDQDFRDKVSDFLGEAGYRDGGRKMRQERANIEK